MTNGITMTNAIIESIVSRSTTKYYDPAVTLSDDQIRELVRIATTAPTSFHMQNWRFIAVRTPEAKARLRPIAWDQPPVTDAAVTFIVCGQLADSSVIPKRLAPVVEAGIMPAKLVPDWENPARGLYFEHPRRQRDEAVRTGAIGATAMIYAARALGLGSRPMIGFDAEAVALLFIDLFFLPESLRKHGLGARVIRTAEEEATRRGCSRAVLFTVTFQAPGFYERQGYEVLGRIECEPPGHTRICMTKKLTAPV